MSDPKVGGKVQLKVGQRPENRCGIRTNSRIEVPGGRAVNPTFTRARKAAVNPEIHPVNGETRPKYRPLSDPESARKCVRGLSHFVGTIQPTFNCGRNPMNTTNDERRAMHRYTVTAKCSTCGAESYGTWLANRALTAFAPCAYCGARIELVAAGLGKACD